MMNGLRTFCALTMAALVTANANADVVVFGETVEFTGPGIYTADVFAQAVGGNHEIGGFNLSIDISDANLTFENAVFGPEFETTLNATSDATSGPVLLQGTDTSFSGLALADGQIGTLVTISFQVNSAADAPLELTANLADVFFSPIASSTGGPISFQVSSVPEPSSFTLCAVAALGVVARRRRKAC